MQVTSFEPKDAININQRKENKLDRALIAIDKNGKQIVNVRIYYPNTVCYSCVWVNYNNQHATGSAQAGGYGYEHRSAAVEEALIKTGFKFDKNFGGTGATLEAVEAVGKFLAGDDFLTVVEAYG